jgi:hypothetical protein
MNFSTITVIHFIPISEESTTVNGREWTDAHYEMLREAQLALAEICVDPWFPLLHHWTNEELRICMNSENQFLFSLIMFPNYYNS